MCLSSYTKHALRITSPNKSIYWENHIYTYEDNNIRISFSIYSSPCLFNFITIAMQYRYQQLCIQVFRNFIHKIIYMYYLYKLYDSLNKS